MTVCFFPPQNSLILKASQEETPSLHVKLFFRVCRFLCFAVPPAHPASRHGSMAGSAPCRQLREPRRTAPRSPKLPSDVPRRRPQGPPWGGGLCA